MYNHTLTETQQNTKIPITWKPTSSKSFFLNEERGGYICGLQVLITTN